MAARGLRVTQALALHEAVGAGVVERWLSAFLLDEGGRSMTSGGADVKLIFWEIACPGKARFRERWVRHQLDSGQGFLERRGASRSGSIMSFPSRPQCQSTHPLLHARDGDQHHRLRRRG